MSWLLSGFADEIDPDPLVQLAVLEALGIAHIEVRSAWDVNVVELAPEQVATLAELFRARGVGVSAVASPIGKVASDVDPDSEVARLRRVIAAAHAFEARYVRIFSFYPPAGSGADAVRDDVLHRMAALAKVAEQENVILLHENEKDIYGDTPQRCVDLFESVGSPALRAAWDAANFVQVGVTRPFDEGFAMLRPYLEYVQVKDAVSDGGRVVPAGAGEGQWEQTLTALRDDGYTGFASMEPHLARAHATGGFSGPGAFGIATRAFTTLLDRLGVNYR
ncbi:sugar phosphate isomerase/epimerase family protein [Pseudonocardia sp. GCM10023141]|uniref:sugar phosphate isomerase/epimerase family protein n=1 Tax=Pseudonocardia sp. GCM10023141 TaxID=3252653 RepID=UPI003617C06C